MKPNMEELRSVTAGLLEKQRKAAEQHARDMEYLRHVRHSLSCDTTGVSPEVLRQVEQLLFNPKKEQ